MRSQPEQIKQTQSPQTSLSTLHTPTCHPKTSKNILLIYVCTCQRHTTNSALRTLSNQKPTGKPKPKHTNGQSCHVSASHILMHDHTSDRRAFKPQNKQLRVQQNNTASASALTTHKIRTSNTTRTKRHAHALLQHAQQSYSSAHSPLK